MSPPAVWPDPLLCTESLAQLAMKFWKSYIVCSWTRLCFTPTTPPQRTHTRTNSHTALTAAPTPTLQLREWDVTDLARCHIWHSTRRKRPAYWSACVRDSKLWLAFATAPAPLHTSLNCVARKFSASRARINQRAPLTKTTLLDLLKKVCLWKANFPQVSLYKNSSVFITALCTRQIVA